MKKGGQHIDKEDFKRYLNDEMSEQERNAFERLLEKNPFEADAIEGVQTIGKKAFFNDLERMKSNFRKNKSKLLWGRVAAVAFLVIVTAVVFYQLDNVRKETTVVQHVQEDTVQFEKIQPKEEEQPIEPELEIARSEKEEAELILEFNDAEVEVDGVEIESQLSLPDENEDQVHIANANLEFIDDESEVRELDEVKPVVQEPIYEAKSIRGISSTKKGKGYTNVPRELLDLLQKNHSLQVVKGTVVNELDSSPLPGVIIRSKELESYGTLTDADGRFSLVAVKDTIDTFTADFVGMKNVEFTSSGSNMVIFMKPENSSLSELVVTGYGAKKSDTSMLKAMYARADRKAIPQIGFASYQNYLDERSTYSEVEIASKKIVKVQFMVDSIGTIKDIIGLNNPDSLLLEKAKKIILEGPKWNPEIRESVPVNSEVKLRIKFHKK